MAPNSSGGGSASLALLIQRIRPLARALVPLGRGDPDDLIHDAFLKMHSRYGGTLSISEEPLLRSTIRSVAIDHHRRQRRSPATADHAVLDDIGHHSAPSALDENLSREGFGQMEAWLEWAASTRPGRAPYTFRELAAQPGFPYRTSLQALSKRYPRVGKSTIKRHMDMAKTLFWNALRFG